MNKDHSVNIDRATKPATLEFAPVFNVAVPFVDRHCGEGRADKLAIRTNQGVEVSYRELADNVNRCGNVLLDLALQRGDRVVLIVKDCAEFFYGFWGAIKAGLVPVPINTLLRAKDYAYILADTGCKALLYSPEYGPEVMAALAQLGAELPQSLCVEGDSDSLRALLPEASADLEPAATSAEDDCFWLYSSGSTGSPKGAVHLHRDMVVTSQCYGVEILDLNEQDVCFSAAKLFFAYGLGNGMTFPLWVGASTVLHDGRPTPQSTFETIEKFRPSLFFGVPTLYAAQLQALCSQCPDLSSLRLCVSAGEALPAEIFNRWREQTGRLILDGIGSTEALHIFISNRADDFKPGSSGRAVPGYQLRITDDAGKDVPIGEPGRLWVRGGSTARCYWNNPAKSAENMVEGWLDTGDTYFQDSAGYYSYCGRNDDMIKVGGIWCSPFEIEAKLIEHDAVLEAAVVGRADGDGLVKPEAYVILKSLPESSAGIAEELRTHCKEGLAPYKYPRQFHFVSELPKTATGKIQRYKLRSPSQT